MSLAMNELERALLDAEKARAESVTVPTDALRELVDGKRQADDANQMLIDAETEK